jgi:hypothetical protein
MVRRRGVLSFVAASMLVACGGLLGFSDDEGDSPPRASTSDSGAETTTATGSTDVDGAASDGGNGGGDADLGDVVIVVPPIDAASDAAPDQLFPRLATFESGALIGPNGADGDNGMSLVGGLKGTYAAQSKSASTWVAFTFAAKPPAELYALFMFRFESFPATQTPAPFFSLVLPGGGNIAAAVLNDGDIYVVENATATKIGNVAVGVTKVFGIHARVAPVALEAVIADDGPLTGVVPVNVGWTAPATITGSTVGTLSSSSMRVTVDHISFRETGFNP